MAVIIIIVHVRRIIPIRIIAVVRVRVRIAPAPIWVPIRVVESAAGGAPPIAAPITATPVSATPVAVFSRFAAAEFGSASWRYRAKMFAVFAVLCAVSAVSLIFVMFRQSSANGDSDGENDRKERFHRTKVFVGARSRAFNRWSSRFRGGSPIQVP
jgi:hypothetical protein